MWLLLLLLLEELGPLRWVRKLLAGGWGFGDGKWMMLQQLRGGKYRSSAAMRQVDDKKGTRMEGQREKLNVVRERPASKVNVALEERMLGTAEAGWTQCWAAAYLVGYKESGASTLGQPVQVPCSGE